MKTAYLSISKSALRLPYNVESDAISDQRFQMLAMSIAGVRISRKPTQAAYLGLMNYVCQVVRNNTVSNESIQLVEHCQLTALDRQTVHLLWCVVCLTLNMTYTRTCQQKAPPSTGTSVLMTASFTQSQM